MKAGTAVARAAPPRAGGPKSDGLKGSTPHPSTPGPQRITAPTNGNPVREGPAVASTHFIRSRIGKICVAITGSTPNDMMRNAEEIVRENHFVEFRLDYLPNPLAIIPRLKQFLYERGEITAIATCRRAATGGKFKGTIPAELEILEKAAQAGCHLIDIELQTAEHTKPAQMKKLRSFGAALIISHHDYEATRNLDAVFDRILPFQPEFIKIVSTARTLADNVTMMRFLDSRRDEANIIGISMGEQGIISRVLGLRAGSV
ncbi:MAG: type I 3-dehydroquinate dehydratase, partial [Acidobacteriaceae bacterium]